MPDNDDLKSLVRAIPDFPKPGIMFRDITTLVRDAHGFPLAIDRMAELVGNGHTVVAGIEARGFIFGAALAQRLGLGFLMIRKKDKLPGHTIGMNYALEYGMDRIEIHADSIGTSDVVLLIDDLIATGGTAEAAVKLIRSTGATISTAAFVIDLPQLGGSQKLEVMDVSSLSLMNF